MRSYSDIILNLHYLHYKWVILHGSIDMQKTRGHDDNNKDEDISANAYNINNYELLSQKFMQKNLNNIAFIMAKSEKSNSENVPDFKSSTLL